MHVTVKSSKFRLALPLLVTAMLWGCGQGDDKGKDKKVEPAPPPKTTPPPPAPKAATPPPPAPKKVEPKKAEAPGKEWVLLGQQVAARGSDRATMQVGLKQGRYNELRFAVTGASLTIDDVTVTFANDEQFKPNVRQEYRDGGATKAVDLPGQNRGIKRIEFVYRTAATGQATIQVHAR